MDENSPQNVIREIDRYYHASFAIAPEKCMPMVMELLNRVEQLSRDFSGGEIAQINRILSEMMTAMENKDYVRLRDCMVYELKPFLSGVQSTL
jgi:hypothetical protein